MHALIDQNFPESYNKAVSASETTDGYFGSRGLFEGDAEIVAGTTDYVRLKSTQSLSMPFLPSVAFSASVPKLKNRPSGFELLSSFPYIEGQNFILSLYKANASVKKSWSGVNKAYSNPPVTSEQVIHPTKYPKEGPIAVSVPAASGGWQVLGSDSLGEVGLFTMFYNQGTVDLANVKGWYSYNSPLSAGWGGDQIVGYENAAGQLGYAWVIEMDTPADAKALLTGYEKMLKLMKAKPGDGLWQLGDEFLKISLVGKKQVMIAGATSAEAVAQLWPGPSLSVVSPNGGEDWQVGTTQTITWTSDGIDAKAKVKIELSLNGGTRPGSRSFLPLLMTEVRIGRSRVLPQPMPR